MTFLISLKHGYGLDTITEKHVINRIASGMGIHIKNIFLYKVIIENNDVNIY